MRMRTTRRRRFLAKGLALAFLTGTTLANAGCFGLVGGIVQAVGGLAGSVLGGGGCSGGG